MKIGFVFKSSSDAAQPLYIRLNEGNERKYVNTGISITSSQFKNGKVVKHNLAVDYNLRIANIEVLFNKYIASDPKPTIHGFLEIYYSGSQDNPSLISWMKSTLATFQIKSKTIDKHVTLIGYLEKFKRDAKISNLDYNFVIEFINFLEKQDNQVKKGQKIKDSYIRSLLTTWKKYGKELVKQGLKDKDVFVGVSYKASKKEPVWLTLDEVSCIENLEVSRGLQATKDAFLFSCYTGLRVKDLNKADIKKVKDGWLKVVPEKTDKHGTVVELPLHKLFWGKPLAILENTGKIRASTDMRIGLRSICEKAGIDKDVTMHIARHTCAMNLLNLGADLETVQKILGHKNIQTTQVYARMLKEGLESRIDKLFG